MWLITPPKYFMYLTSSIALLLIKIVMGNLGLLGAWNLTNLVCFQISYWYHLQRKNFILEEMFGKSLI